MKIKYVIISLLLVVIFILNGKITLGQKIRTDTICNSVNYDTLDVNLLVELNSSQKYYHIQGTSVQNNMIHIDNGFERRNLFELFNSDTIIAFYWEKAFRVFKDRNKCLDLNSISSFKLKMDGTTLSKREKRKYRRSTITDNFGLKYLKVKASIIVIDVGPGTWLYPSLYNKSENNLIAENLSATKKEYTHTLVLAEVINFDVERIK